MFYKPLFDEDDIMQHIRDLEESIGATMKVAYLPSDGVADNDKGFSCEVNATQLESFFREYYQDLAKVTALGPVPEDAKELMEEIIPQYITP